MNIFVSYTTRDDNVDKTLLESISEIVSLYGHCYIDLLHKLINEIICTFVIVGNTIH